MKSISLTLYKKQAENSSYQHAERNVIKGTRHPWSLHVLLFWQNFSKKDFVQISIFFILRQLTDSD
jgi:hypothetical protein